MILVDTSAWVDFFRGKRGLADQVDQALQSGEAALCGPVLTELIRGLRTPAERAQVMDLLEGCQLLEQPDRLWEEAGALGAYLKRKGATVKTLDLLIATYALAHHAPILTADSDFALMKRAGLPVELF